MSAGTDPGGHQKGAPSPTRSPLPVPPSPHHETPTNSPTPLRLVDWKGKAQGADKVVPARFTGDIAVLKDGTLTWAYVPVTPSCTSALSGASPIATSLRIGRLEP
ncbi:hypothetical protein ACFWBR_23175 [Streptomyces sp. NPDC060006]|uniref:hypothetical protein n=1 Tax=unclassified Streptomyces TaxID=2593676 RepID=UPI0036851F99